MLRRVALIGLLACSSCEGLSLGVEPVDDDGRCELVSEQGGASTPIVMDETLEFRFFEYDAFCCEDPAQSPVGIDEVTSSDPEVVRVELLGADDEGFHRIGITGLAAGVATVDATSDDGPSLSLSVTVVTSAGALRFGDAEACAAEVPPRRLR